MQIYRLRIYFREADKLTEEEIHALEWAVKTQLDKKKLTKNMGFPKIEWDSERPEMRKGRL